MFSALNEDLVPSLGYGTTDQPNHQMESVLNTAESLAYHVSPQLHYTSFNRLGLGKRTDREGLSEEIAAQQEISFPYKPPNQLVILVG